MGSQFDFVSPPRAYAPCGCIVRVVSLTKSQKIPTEKLNITAFFRLQAFLYEIDFDQLAGLAGLETLDLSGNLLLDPLAGTWVVGSGPRREPFNFTPRGVDSIPPAHLHVRPMARTCR